MYSNEFRCDKNILWYVKYEKIKYSKYNVTQGEIFFRYVYMKFYIIHLISTYMQSVLLTEFGFKTMYWIFNIQILPLAINLAVTDSKRTIYIGILKNMEIHAQLIDFLWSHTKLTDEKKKIFHIGWGIHSQDMWSNYIWVVVLNFECGYFV